MKSEGQSWSPQHMPMAISANWAVLAALFMNYDAAITPDRSVNKHWWCLEEKMASLGIIWPSKATRKTFSRQNKDFPAERTAPRLRNFATALNTITFA